MKGDKNSWKYSHRYAQEHKPRQKRMDTPPKPQMLWYASFPLPTERKVFDYQIFDSKYTSTLPHQFTIYVKANRHVSRITVEGMDISYVHKTLRLSPYLSEKQFSDLAMGLAMVGRVVTEIEFADGDGKVKYYKLNFEYSQDFASLESDLRHAVSLAYSGNIAQIIARREEELKKLNNG